MQALFSMLHFDLSVTSATPFWELVREAKCRTDQSLTEQQHLFCFDVEERLDARHCAPLCARTAVNGAQDINFSNVGRYLFSPNYGPLTLRRLYYAGGGWVPTFGGCMFAVSAVTHMSYSLVFQASERNAGTAKAFLDEAVRVTEAAHALPEAWTLADYLDNRSHSAAHSRL